MKNSFAEGKAAFDAEKKSEEWGREGLRGKLRAAEDLLAKERADWKKICEKDNQRMYATRVKITELEGKVAELTGKVEDAQAAKENAEVWDTFALSPFVLCLYNVSECFYFS